jgi:seryl-tRNA synthetase
VEELCDLLKLSAEQGHFISKKLTARGVIEQIESGYGTRLFIKDHLKIEDIPSDQQESSLADELKEFQSSKKEFSKEIESFQAEQAKKKKSMFAELEKKLKKELDTE